MRRLWSSDRHCLAHSSFGGQVTTESCSFQTNMLPLSLLPQRRDSEAPHSLTSVCVSGWMFQEGKVQCASWICHYLLTACLCHSPHPEVLGQVDSRQVWQAERKQDKHIKKTFVFDCPLCYLGMQFCFSSHEGFKNSGELIRSKTGSIWEQQPIQSSNSYTLFFYASKINSTKK